MVGKRCRSPFSLGEELKSSHAEKRVLHNFHGDGQSKTQEVDRSNKTEIRQISDHLFVQLLVDALKYTYYIRRPWLTAEHCKILGSAEGSFNYCKMIKVLDQEEFVVKVPFAGTWESWTAEDREKME
jgi:hypothetical protein